VTILSDETDRSCAPIGLFSCNLSKKASVGSAMLAPRLSSPLSIANEPLSIGEAFLTLEALFQHHQLDDPRESARILVCAVAGCNSAVLMTTPTKAIPEKSWKLLCDFARRRLEREPISRILGCREFWGLDLKISRAVLDPRADTETLVETCVNWIRERGLKNPNILDVGTGSGAVLCAVLSEIPDAKGLGIDISAEACAVAQNNLYDLGLSERASISCIDMASFREGEFDVILSNPPYIRSSEIKHLDPEVRSYDPHLALDGGPDGLRFYRILVSKYRQWKNPYSLCAVEIGQDQGSAVKEILREVGVRANVKVDLAGRDRIVCWEC